MGQTTKQTFIQRRHTDGQEAHEKMLNITNYQRNASQNCKKVTPHTSQNDDHGEGVEKMNSPNCQWECRLVQPLWRTVRRFLKKIKTELPYDPVIPLLGICPEKILTEKDTSTPKFIAAVFTTAKTWKQPKCPLTDEQVKT